MDSVFGGLDKGKCFVPSWARHMSYPTLRDFESGKNVAAHRWLTRVLIGKLQRGDDVLHRCGNSQCCNPHHLYVGSEVENTRDRILHERARARTLPAGEALCKDDVLRPVVLSAEISRYPDFQGFQRQECVYPRDYHLTYDGYAHIGDVPFIPRENKKPWPGVIIGFHKMIFNIFIGKIRKNDLVKHRCGDRSCINPYHLYFDGTHFCEEYMNFLYDPRFGVPPVARKKAADTDIPILQLVKEYGVHPQTLWTIRRDARA